MTHKIKDIAKISTVKELATIAKELDIKGISKFKKEDLRKEIIEVINEAMKGMPVNGPEAVAEAMDGILELIPEYFETEEDLSTEAVPHLTRTLGEKLAADTVVLHADFGKAGTKQARVYVIQKCFGQRNSTLHIFSAKTPDVTVKFLELLGKHRG